MQASKPIAITIVIVACCLLASCSRQPPADSPAKPAIQAIPPLPHIQCHRAAGAISIDGQTSEPAWQAADKVHMVRLQGGKPRHNTQVRVLWDDEYLYVAFDCEDPQPTFGVRLTKRDAPVWKDANVVEVFVNPTGGGQTHYSFELNPLNTLYDHFDSNPKWNAAGIRTATHIKKVDGRTVGWSAEFAFPLKCFANALSTPPKPGHIWRINFYRYNMLGTLPADTPDLYAWSRTMTDSFHVAARFGYIHFVK